jgi:hypothetical protein
MISITPAAVTVAAVGGIVGGGSIHSAPPSKPKPLPPPATSSAPPAPTTASATAVTAASICTAVTQILKTPAPSTGPAIQGQASKAANAGLNSLASALDGLASAIDNGNTSQAEFLLGRACPNGT